MRDQKCRQKDAGRMRSSGGDGEEGKHSQWAKSDSEAVDVQQYQQKDSVQHSS
jgi:hypothetical protein